MEDKALPTAQWLADHYMHGLGSGPIDGDAVVRAAMAGFLAGSGVPTNQAVHMVEMVAARNLVCPSPPNPMYHGIPAMIAGPVSGAPYYC